MNVKPLFKLMVDKKASDLFFTTYSPVMIKIDGKIMPVNQVELSPKMVRQAALELMNETQLETFTRDLEIDFAISEPGLGRFRVNVFHQRGNVAMVLRFITPELPQLDALGMPEVIKDMIMLRRGLILMVGASGSGKSTTLAAMIDYRNKNSASHIVTIEDPIEFLHSNQKSIVNQREVGLDTHSYHRALRSAMREAPDVILIGEIRDRETMQAAIDLAGTGHLAIATLHANNSPETLDRIINMYPNDQHKQVLMDLAQYIRVIISQRLVRSKEGKRVAAVEIMLNTPHISEMILKGDISAVKEAFKDTKEPGHAELRPSVVRPLSARPHQHGRGAVERRLALEPRSEDQLRLVGSGVARARTRSAGAANRGRFRASRRRARRRRRASSRDRRACARARCSPRSRRFRTP